MLGFIPVIVNPRLCAQISLSRRDKCFPSYLVGCIFCLFFFFPPFVPTQLEVCGSPLMLIELHNPHCILAGISSKSCDLEPEDSVCVCGGEYLEQQATPLQRGCVLSFASGGRYFPKQLLLVKLSMPARSGNETLAARMQWALPWGRY